MRRLVILILSLGMLLAGCSTVTDGDTNNTDIEQSIAPPTEADVFQLLREAANIEAEVYQQGFTTEGIYEQLGQYFTKNYVDTIILGGGNLKLEGDKWVIAHVGSEFIEGTYFFADYIEETTIAASADNLQVRVTNLLGDGLYAPHYEHITLVYEAGSWKLDYLEWEYLK